MGMTVRNVCCVCSHLVCHKLSYEYVGTKERMCVCVLWYGKGRRGQKMEGTVCSSSIINSLRHTTLHHDVEREEANDLKSSMQ